MFLLGHTLGAIFTTKISQDTRIFLKKLAILGVQKTNLIFTVGNFLREFSIGQLLVVSLVLGVPQ